MVFAGLLTRSEPLLNVDPSRNMKRFLLFLSLLVPLCVAAQPIQTKTMLKSLSDLTNHPGAFSEWVGVLAYSNTNYPFTKPLYYELRDDLSTTLHNPPLYVREKNNRGVWRAHIVGANVMDPDWFGAIPDGLTDASSAFMAAHAALTNGGTIEASVGTYALVTPLVFTRKVSLVGAGFGVTILKRSGGNTNPIVTYNAGSFNNGWYVRNLSFNGNTVAPALYLYQFGDGVVENCEFYNLGKYAIENYQTVHMKVLNNRIRDFADTNGFGVNLAGAASGHTIQGNSFATAATAIQFTEPSNGLLIMNNTFEGNRYGIRAPRLGSGSINSLSIIGNFFEANSVSPLEIGSGASGNDLQGFTLIGNEFASAGNGPVTIDGAAFVTVMGNRFGPAVEYRTNLSRLRLEGNRYSSTRTITVPTERYRNDDDLILRNVSDNSYNLEGAQFGVGQPNPQTKLDVVGTIRTTSNVQLPTNGSGLEWSFQPSPAMGLIQSLNRTTNTYLPLSLRASYLQGYGWAYLEWPTNASGNIGSPDTNYGRLWVFNQNNGKNTLVIRNPDGTDDYLGQEIPGAFRSIGGGPLPTNGAGAELYYLTASTNGILNVQNRATGVYGYLKLQAQETTLSNGAVTSLVAHGSGVSTLATTNTLTYLIGYITDASGAPQRQFSMTANDFYNTVPMPVLLSGAGINIATSGRTNTFTTKIVAGSGISVTTNGSNEIVINNIGTNAPGATNGTSFYVDSIYSTVLNFINSAELDPAASGTNLTVSIVVNSIETNKVSAAFRSFFKDRSTDTGTQLAATISDFADATWAQLTNSLVASNNISFAYDPSNKKLMVSSTGGSGSATNVPTIAIDGVTTTNLNFADSSELLVTKVGTNVTYALATNGVTAGTYSSATVTVDSKGRVTSIASGTPAGTTSMRLNVPLMNAVTAVTVPSTEFSETSLVGTLKPGQSNILAAGTLTNGTIIRVRAQGSFTVPSSDWGNGTFKVKIGSVTISGQMAEMLSYQPNPGGWQLEANLSVTTAGTNATVVGGGLVWNQESEPTASSGGNVFALVKTGTLDTTSTNVVALTFQNNVSQPLTLVCNSFEVMAVGADVTISGGSGGGGIAGIQINGSGSSSNAVDGTTLKFTQSGGNFSGYVTNIDATLLTGTIDDARIPAGIARDSEMALLYGALVGANLWTGANNFQGPVTMSNLTVTTMTVTNFSTQNHTNAGTIQTSNLVSTATISGTNANLTGTLNVTNVAVSGQITVPTSTALTSNNVAASTEYVDKAVASATPVSYVTRMIGTYGTATLTTTNTWYIPSSTRSFSQATAYDHGSISIPYKLKIVGFDIKLRVSTTSGASNIPCYIRTNNLNDVSVGSYSLLSVGDYITNVSGLDIKLNAGDTFAFKYQPTNSDSPVVGGWLTYYMQPW